MNIQLNKKGRSFRIEIEYQEEETELCLPQEFVRQLQDQQGKNWKLLLADVLDVVGMLLGGQEPGVTGSPSNAEVKRIRGRRRG